MKIFRFLSVLVLFTLITLDGQAKGGRECLRMYAFGFSASFNDSTVYFTEIQSIDSAWVDSSNFLMDRQEYSSQLKNYFTGIGESNRTCVIFYAKTEKDIMKKYLSLRKRYENPKKGRPRFRVVNVMKDAFRFQSVTPSSVEEKPVMTRRKLKAARKAAEKAAKAAEKQQVQQVTP